MVLRKVHPVYSLSPAAIHLMSALVRALLDEIQGNLRDARTGAITPSAVESATRDLFSGALLQRVHAEATHAVDRYNLKSVRARKVKIRVRLQEKTVSA